MCFDNNRNRRDVDLICECRRVRFDRDNRVANEFDRRNDFNSFNDFNRRNEFDRINDFNRNNDFRCRCREVNNHHRRRCWWM